MELTTEVCLACENGDHDSANSEMAEGVVKCACSCHKRPAMGAPEPKPDFIYAAGILKFEWMPRCRMLRVWSGNTPDHIISIWGQSRERCLESLKRVYGSEGWVL